MYAVRVGSSVGEMCLCKHFLLSKYSKSRHTFCKVTFIVGFCCKAEPPCHHLETQLSLYYPVFMDDKTESSEKMKYLLNIALYVDELRIKLMTSDSQSGSCSNVSHCISSIFIMKLKLIPSETFSGPKTYNKSY